MPGTETLIKSQGVTDPRGEPDIVILLNGHAVKFLFMFLPIDQGCSRSWSEKLHYAVSNHHCRDEWLVTVARIKDRVISLKQDTYIIPIQQASGNMPCEFTETVVTYVQSSQNSGTDGGNDLQAPPQTEGPLAEDNS